MNKDGRLAMAGNGQAPAESGRAAEPAEPVAPAELIERPGCVTVHAAATGGLALLAAALLIIQLGRAATTLAAGQFPLSLLGETPATLLVAGLLVAQLLGLWRMNKWGWWLTMLLHGVTGALALWGALLTLLLPQRDWLRNLDTYIVLAAAIILLGWYYPRQRLFDSDIRDRDAWLANRPPPPVTGRFTRPVIAALFAVALAWLALLAYLLSAQMTG
jgi:hypothetical protein